MSGESSAEARKEEKIEPESGIAYVTDQPFPKAAISHAVVLGI